jgi:hypothetical protein
MACGADPAVVLAALDDCAAGPAVPRVQFAGARFVGVVGVAAIIVFVDGSLEDIGGTLECGEFGAPVLELDANLSKSCSCSRPSVIHATSLSMQRSPLRVGTVEDPVSR